MIGWSHLSGDNDVTGRNANEKANMGVKQRKAALFFYTNNFLHDFLSLSLPLSLSLRSLSNITLCVVSCHGGGHRYWCNATLCTHNKPLKLSVGVCMKEKRERQWASEKEREWERKREICMFTCVHKATFHSDNVNINAHIHTHTDTHTHLYFCICEDFLICVCMCVFLQISEGESLWPVQINRIPVELLSSDHTDNLVFTFLQWVNLSCWPSHNINIMKSFWRYCKASTGLDSYILPQNALKKEDVICATCVWPFFSFTGTQTERHISGPQPQKLWSGHVVRPLRWEPWCSKLAQIWRRAKLPGKHWKVSCGVKRREELALW